MPRIEGRILHYYFRHDKIILLQDNARPRVAAPVKMCIETLIWEVLHQLMYLLLPITTCSDRYHTAALHIK